MNIVFYQEVEVKENAKNSKYAKCKGVVLGISEEDGIVYGYSVVIHGKETTAYFEKEDVFPTGVFYRREDFY